MKLVLRGSGVWQILNEISIKLLYKIIIIQTFLLSTSFVTTVEAKPKKNLLILKQINYKRSRSYPRGMKARSSNSVE